MEVCGTHTMAIARSGIKRLLPAYVRLISGPGCPVCVTPQSEIDRAIAISMKFREVIIATFGDMMRVPGSQTSFNDLKRTGHDIRIVYSPMDAVELAYRNADRKVVFMGVGFETTAPAVALTVLEAKERKITNYFVLANFKLLFPALSAVSSTPRVNIDGFICPGHVSVITGVRPYEEFVRRYKKPCVITGFEDSDIIEGIRRLIQMVRNNENKVYVEYGRAVGKEGNKKARSVLNKVFETRDSEWRGLGLIRESGLRFRKAYEEFDAESHFPVALPAVKRRTACLCGEVLTGIKAPKQCALFGKGCTPLKPAGPCMVSSEGTCAAYYKYG